METSFDFSVIVNQKKLGSLFEKAIDDALGDEIFEVNSLALKMSRNGNADIVPDGKSLNIVLPYHIDIYRSAGLFSIEASAAIHLELKVDYDITPDLAVKTDTSLVRYGWIEKPKVEIGIINIPMERVLDLLIKHYEGVITAKIDASIREKANLSEIVEQGMKELHAKINDMDTNGIYPQLHLSKLVLVPPALDESNDISIVGRVYPEIGVSDIQHDYNYKHLSIEWVDSMENTDNQLEVTAAITYDYLAKQILDNTKGMDVAGRPLEIENVIIENKHGMLSVEATITAPIHAQAVVTAVPFYNDKSGMLSLDDVDVKLNPSNIIYKLTTPLVNSFIENKIDSMFPMAVNKVLNEQIAGKIPESIDIPDGKAVIDHDELRLLDLNFRDEDLTAKAAVINLDFIATIA